MGDKDSSNPAFSGNLGDGVTRTYSSGIIYSSLGGMTKEKFGTDTAIYNKLFYNVRGQLAEIRESTSYTGPADEDFDRGAIINFYGSYWGKCGGSNSTTQMADNNGNLKRQEIYIPGGPSFAQTFGYDSLNRLQSVSEDSSWRQEYVYDRYGNRTINGNVLKTFGNGINNVQTVVSTATNRMYGPNETDASHALMDYDPAGNQTKDALTTNGLAAGTRTYDAENRQTIARDGSGNQIAAYTYNADGQRVRRNVTGQAAVWQVYGIDGELLAEYSARAYPFLPQKEYGYRNGQLLVTVANGDEDRLSQFINNLYSGAFGRLPTQSEMATAENNLGAATSQTQLYGLASRLGLGLFQSQEYDDRRRSDDEYVDDLYRAYLQRAPDSSGHEFWLGVVGDSGRAAVYAAFQGSEEFSWLTTRVYGGNLLGDDDRLIVFVHRLYLGALGREEDSQELSAGLSQLNAAAAQGRAAVVVAARGLARSLYQSAEYQGRKRTNGQFVIDLFDGLLGRTTGDIVAQHWELAVEVDDREQVFENFTAGGEFVALAGTLYREANWLVTDQLGTPRIIFDKTGSLAATKRHDYLPFGEELFANQGARTSTLGYGADGVRQKFTQKERDIETGLDYFGARYYGSIQGRFTSPDPLLSSGHPGDPQSWNHYSYTLNNPLCFVDPTGLFTINPKLRHEEQEQIIAAYDALKASLGKLKEGSKAYEAVERSLAKLGAPGDANGVVVTIGKTDAKADGETDVSKINKGTITITFNKDRFSSDSVQSRAGTLGHEGVHADDASNIFASSKSMTGFVRAWNSYRYKTEYNAFWVNAGILQAIGKRDSEYGWGYYTPPTLPGKAQNIPHLMDLWNPSWRQLDQRQIETKQGATIRTLLQAPNSTPFGYGLKEPKNFKP